MHRVFEKIIEKLKEKKTHETFCDKEVGFNKGIRMSIEIVKQVSEEYVSEINVGNINHWIPCSERLPEKSGEYLVTYHPCYWDSVQDGVKVGIDTFRGKTTWARNKYQKVIAWKPLPEVYVEKMGV